MNENYRGQYLAAKCASHAKRPAMRGNTRIMRRIDIGFKDVVIDGNNTCVRYKRLMHRRKIRSFSINKLLVHEMVFGKSDNVWLRSVFGSNPIVFKYI